MDLRRSIADIKCDNSSFSRLGSGALKALDFLFVPLRRASAGIV